MRHGGSGCLLGVEPAVDLGGGAQAAVQRERRADGAADLQRELGIVEPFDLDARERERGGDARDDGAPDACGGDGGFGSTGIGGE